VAVHPMVSGVGRVVSVDCVVVAEHQQHEFGID